MSISALLLILALIAFLFAAAGVPTGRVNLIAVGLALWVLALLIGGRVVLGG